jgi:RNA polymerase sigma-70 factor (ECF subfamily)
MTAPELDQRLSRIATLWSVVFQAHGGQEAAAEARNRLLLRYSGAVYRYLLGAVRDPDAAADLCQDFAVRFLHGDFRRADPGRGRFRDYVKAALVNLANDYHRRRQARPLPLAADASEPAAAAVPSLPSESDFVSGWRRDLLNQTWAALATDHPAYHAVLLLRVENPDMQSPALTANSGERLGKPLTPANARKMLQRAHAKFADVLLDRVAESLTDPTADSLAAELKVLDLLKFCRTALARRSVAPPG